jgi:O-6-methylguanine DNA methyltransferase
MNQRFTGILRGDPAGALQLRLLPFSGSAHDTVDLVYEVADSSAGYILIAGTVEGASWIGIHGSVEHLEREMRADLIGANFTRLANRSRIAEAVLAMINGGPFELPVDICGTPFQIDVWRELCAIPRGASRSYGEIARRLGKPAAVRAVGHANGSNPLAIVIPCHRAIGSDGKLTGYRWGIDLKRRLLEIEGTWPLQSELRINHAPKLSTPAT